MNVYRALKTELELTKYELEARLKQLSDTAQSEKVALFSHNLFEAEKDALFIMDMKKELEDVTHALQKFDDNTYGICEETGELIPIEQLTIMPQARYKDEAVMFV